MSMLGGCLRDSKGVQKASVPRDEMGCQYKIASVQISFS